MKLSLHFTFVDLAGNDISYNGEVQWLDKSLANNLTNAVGPEPVKFNDWALKLYREGEIEVDQTDWDKLKKFVMDMKDVSNGYKAQLLSHFVLIP